jgi:hypothetical protein
VKALHGQRAIALTQESDRPKGDPGSCRDAKAVTYRSDKSEGPTAGTETVDPLEFLARVLVYIPDKGHVTTRYYGWYANRDYPRATTGAP